LALVDSPVAASAYPHADTAAAKTVAHPGGWLLIDKPLGVTSNAVLARLKRQWGWKKLGFVGTLDPLASGVLAVAVGAATRTIPLLNDDRKCYDFELHFGQQTSSDDAEGGVVATSDHRPSLDQIVAAIPAFVGAIDQRPPAFSAIKLAGRPAYALARAGQAPIMAMRRVRIDGVEVVSSDQLPDFITLRVTCGGGTYVRSLARDLAVAVGTVGHARAIRRLQSGPAALAAAQSLAQALESPRWIGLSQLLPSQAVAHIDAERWQQVRQGKAIALHGHDWRMPDGGQSSQQPSCASGIFPLKREHPVVLLLENKVAGVGWLSLDPEHNGGDEQRVIWSPKMVFVDLTVCWK
jgi:tRNA pseudouridine55 synthase